MTTLSLVTWPDKRLVRACKPVAEFGPELANIAADMRDLMVREEGIGLAAPQVGLDMRLLVCLQDDEDSIPYAFINPRIVERKGETISNEGCLSLPGVTVPVKRAESVSVLAQHTNGDQFRVDATGRLAIVLQHEIDHLDGMLMLDRTDPASKFLAIQTMKRQT